MKKIIITSLLFLFFSSLPLINFAQQSGPGDPGGGPTGGDPPIGGGAPIGSGVIILMGLAAIYGSTKVYILRKKHDGDNSITLST
jgi:hypothetical protein